MGDAWDPSFDRHRPAFAVLAPAMAPFRACREWPTIEAWNEVLPAIHTAGGAPLRFIPQPPKRSNALPYDERIYARGEVPSRRDNWHDFFNMLVWVTFPATKRAINARQRAALHARGELPRHRRLPEQDALAMLDEGGAIVAYPGPAQQRLLAHTGVTLEDAVVRADVETLGGAVRDGAARVWIFGHAIYEHLVTRDGTVRALAQLVRCDTLEHRDDADALEGGCTPLSADRALAAALEKTSVRYDKTALALPIVDALFR